MPFLKYCYEDVLHSFATPASVSKMHACFTYKGINDHVVDLNHCLAPQ